MSEGYCFSVSEKQLQSVTLTLSSITLFIDNKLKEKKIISANKSNLDK